ncbi:hypothetical protein ZOSMA_70G00160 [Zostera marina]|uniref:Uncharacterized protein n=1 Tax=Zostera marina TaxID=29655 RepID=A0A0K9NSE8_ZOSMR|nr:hypothetical protein ZOSMA_70G00160 [Zostera marina]
MVEAMCAHFSSWSSIDHQVICFTVLQKKRRNTSKYS